MGGASSHRPEMGARGEAGGLTECAICNADDSEPGNLSQILFFFFFFFLLVQLHAGYSLANYPERVSQSISAGLPWTLGLLGVSTLISFSIGTLLGGLLAWPTSGRLVRLVGFPLIMLSAVPYFVLGIVLLFLFALAWPLFPVGGGYPFSATLGWNWDSVRAVLYHAMLPSLSIVLASIGTWAIAMRGMIVSVLGEDYIMLAEAKGLPPRRIFSATACETHCSRNSLISH